MGQSGCVRCDEVVTDATQAIKIAWFALRRWRKHPHFDEMESEALVVIAKLLGEARPGLIIVAISRMCYRMSKDGLIRMSYQTADKQGLKRVPLSERPVVSISSLEWRELTERVDEESILHYWFQGYTDLEIGNLILKSQSYVQKKRGVLIRKLWELYNV